MSNTSNNKQKKVFFLSRWFKRMFFGPQKELSFMEEEALQSPLRLVVDNFLARRLSVIGVVVFAIVFLFVMPVYFPAH